MQGLVQSIVRRTLLECANQPENPLAAGDDPLEIFHSPRAEAIKEEIVRTGKKLWQRQYVDGNGGNISARISDRYVICTPTLVSKGDLQVEDLALVDLENRRVCGHRKHTSELLLHLEIYKAVPEAKAVIHCHPPYATAHAVAGVVPTGDLVPEQEVFIGPVALTPYETPGTMAFAQTVRPVARNHNTILLANHGVACWADTVTHAEWYVEIIDTYCKTLMLARQLRPELPAIPPEKIAEILAMKKKLGMSLPDARFGAEEATGAAETGTLQLPGRMDPARLDQLADLLTERVMALFEEQA